MDFLWILLFPGLLFLLWLIVKKVWPEEREDQERQREEVVEARGEACEEARQEAPAPEGPRNYTFSDAVCGILVYVVLFTGGSFFIWHVFFS